MMTFARGAIAFSLAALASSAGASPLTMTFCVENLPNAQYRYTFTLTLDNHDNTWHPGNGFGIGGIVFADSPNGPAVLDDFVVDVASFPIGPWTSYSPISGGHNGTNLLPIAWSQPPYNIIYWTPTAIGQTLTWRGTSSHLTMQLQWSALFATAGFPVNFASMNGTVCGGGPTCGSADFDCDGDTATDADIESFFACLAGNCPAAPCASTADFNGDGDTATDADIESFFRVLAGGHC
jgi:hypothetical protein